jgi:hypothetical protein
VIVLIVFLVSSATTVIYSDSYLLTFVKIGRCPVVPPRPGLALVECTGISSKFYYSGSLYLDVDQDLIASLRAADVVILGNSRTQRTFPSESITRFFAEKHLRYFILASEGSGFRFSQMILEKLSIKPKIYMVNSETFWIDILEDTNREVVLYPDKFKLALSAFFRSKKLQESICNSSIEFLKDLYCKGATNAGWRDLKSGALWFDPNNAPDPPGRILVEVPAETRMSHFETFMKNARIFLSSPSVRDVCLIEYVIPSNNSSVDLARRMAAAMDAAFVYPIVSNLYSFDGSHLLIESSERWSAEFVKLVDSPVDSCLKRTRK